MNKKDATVDMILTWLDRASEAKLKETDRVNDEWQDRVSMQSASIALLLIQVFCLVMFGICVRGMTLDAATASGTGTQGYNMFCGVAIMMFIGFGYLMTFMKWHGLTAVGFTMMVTAIGLQYGVLTENFFDQWYNSYPDWHYIEITIYSLLNSLYAISAVLITFGALIGKVTPFQLIIITLIEIALHSMNYVVIIGGLEVADMGGTYIDHMFGAYFGLAVAYVLGKPTTEPEMGHTPDIFSLIGTLFLWIYWPSFVAGAAGADSDQQQRAIVNTILALSSGTITAFFSSSFFNTKGQFRPVDIQNATLAGGVAIGCVANLSLSPAGSLFIGCVASFVSTIGYYIIQPYLENTWGLHDTCGIHNLHAMPSIIGALASIIVARTNADIDKDIYDQGGDASLDSAEGSQAQWWKQLTGMLCVLGFAIFTGIITGYIVKFFSPFPVAGIDAPALSTEQVKVEEKTPLTQSFHDNEYWEVADDYGRSFYTELGLVVKGSGNDASIEQKLQSLDSSSHHGRRIQSSTLAQENLASLSRSQDGQTAAYVRNTKVSTVEE
jgi:ammonium transporter Rh